MSNITVVPSDGAIGIDGNFLLKIDPQYLTWIPNDVHVFHWYSDRNEGEIEFKAHPFDPKRPNERVTELGIFAQAITTFEEESLRREQQRLDELAAIEASRDYWQELREARNWLLTQSDWTQLSDAPLTEAQKIAWSDYRQELRDLPESITDPKPLVDDPNHPSWPIPPS
jgi:hypothetical protein